MTFPRGLIITIRLSIAKLYYVCVTPCDRHFQNIQSSVLRNFEYEAHTKTQVYKPVHATSQGPHVCVYPEVVCLVCVTIFENELRVLVCLGKLCSSVC